MAESRLSTEADDNDAVDGVAWLVYCCRCCCLTLCITTLRWRVLCWSPVADTSITLPTLTSAVKSTWSVHLLSLLYFALLQLSLICALFSQNSRFLIACILHCKACVPCDLMFSFKLINGIFLILAYPGCPGKEAVKQMCLCVNN